MNERTERAALRLRQRLGFVLVALGAGVVIGADYFLGATTFVTPPRLVGFVLVAAGVLVQGWVVLTRRSPRG